MVLKGLHILDIHYQHITGLCCLDIEGSCKVVHASEVDVLDVVRGVVVFDLAAGPVYAFNLDGFVVFDCCAGGDCWERVCVSGRVMGEWRGLEGGYRQGAICSAVSVSERSSFVPLTTLMASNTYM